MRNSELREAGIFFGLTLALSYLVFWGPLAVFRIPTVNLVGGSRGPVWAITLFILGGFVPSLTAVALTAVFEGRRGVGKLLRRAFQVRLSLKWYAVMLSVALYFVAALLAVYTLLGGRFDYSQFWRQLPTLLPLIILGPLSEEYGWRGFALERLLKRMDAVKATLIVGSVWALWHLPLFFAPGTSQNQFHMPFLPFAAAVIGSSFVYTYLYLRTDGNLFTAVFTHWTYTYVVQVVSSTIVRSAAYNWLEAVPGLLAGLFFVCLLRGERGSLGHPGDAVVR